MRSPEIREMKLKDLKPSDYNPRKKLKPGDPEFEKLRRSLQEFGYVDPIVWNRKTKRVVGGHQRLEVMRELGVETCKVLAVDLPDDREKALNIALNKIRGEWDMPLLKELIIELTEKQVDVSLSGFDPVEVEALGLKENPFPPAVDPEHSDEKECPACGFVFNPNEVNHVEKDDDQGA
jgi:ParB-like chromosome segregation protein Spo0J